MTAIRKEPTLAAPPKAAVAPRSESQPRYAAPIMPEGTVAGRSLLLVVVLMSYLACLALAGVLIISQAVSTWSADIARELTLQIRPVEGSNVDTEVEKAYVILQSTRGVTSLRIIDKAKAAELLEPWLGSMPVIEDLPIPRMIAIQTDPNNPPDLAALRSALAAEIPGAELDTHQQWQAQLSRTADTLRWIGYGVLAIITVATAAVTVFATRAAIAANRNIVEVLHLVGARDRFIAGQVQWHFVKLAFRAGIIGTVAGAISVALLALVGPGNVPGGLTAASRALIFAPTTFALQNYALFLLIPIVAVVVSLVTSRVTVMRILSEVL
ncbi:cell division protein FtsX [Rhodoligotrophos defluvii]|uniref:cell division protein FtsX n=1 Tax=Rhodoligotrophos defluvii TaxID=2561934 RepID=UPI0010C96C81|nr:FtsX-like permease family protein [Rhodoligotrophos defluvii]